MKLRAAPGVFRPRSDTRLLAGVLAGQYSGPGRTVLDLCTGSGALAVAAARAGAADVTAVDLSRRAVLTTRSNARRNRVRVRVRRGDLFAPVAGWRFDTIVSNPPYLPSALPHPPRHGAGRATEAGPDGRLLLNRICADAPRHLRPGGSVLLVHSSLCGVEGTCSRLSEGGLAADVVTRRGGRLGPLLSARAELLAERGLLAGGVREEELVVVRGRRPA